MNIRKKCTWLLLIAGILILFTACGKKEAKLADDVFLKASVTSKGQGVETYEMYTLNLEFHQNGTVRCYADNFNRWLSQEECPEETMQISAEDVQRLQEYIEEVDLYHMRENIGNRDLTEGEYKELTVYTTDGEHTAGGLNPSNRDFLKVYEETENLTRETVFTYRTKITQMQKKGLQYHQAKGLYITDAQENQIVPKEAINDVYVTYGTEHQKLVGDAWENQQTEDDEKESVMYYVTLKLADDAAGQMAETTNECTVDKAIYYKLYVNETYAMTFGVQAPVKNGELYVYETIDAQEAKQMAQQYRSSIYD